MLTSAAMGGLRSARSFNLRQAILDATIEVLREFGAQGCEGIVLWAGNLAGDRVIIERCLMPPQKSIVGQHGVGYAVDGEDLFALNRYLNNNELRLIAQVHSHPGEAYHSNTDDELAIVTVEGGLSIVVPDFAKGPANLSRWAIYRLLDGCWTALSRKNVADLFVIT